MSMWGPQVGRKRSGGWAWGSRATPKKAKTVQAKLTKLQRQIAYLKPETKYAINTVTSTNVVAGTGVIFPLAICNEGTNQDERAGVQVRGIHLNIINSYARTSMSAGDTYRLMVIKDKNSNGAAPTIASANAAVLTSFTPTSAFLNNNARPRFTVLYDKIVTVEAIDYNTFYNDVQRISLKLNFPIHYVSTSTAAASQGTNSVWFLILPSSSTGDFVTAFEFAFTDV